MRYFVLEFEVKSDGYYAERLPLKDSRLSESMFSGLPFQGFDTDLELPKGRGNLQDFLPNVQGFTIVSEPVKNLFLEFGGDYVEAFQIEINRRTEQEYFLINILGNIDCIDLERSEYELYAPEVLVLRKIFKLVLDENKIGGRHIFRVKNLRKEIVVSEQLKLAIEQANIDKATFTRVEDYTKDLTKSKLSKL